MKKLAIVCGSPSTEMLAPFQDPEFDVWVLGNRRQKYPRYDLIFEIHDDLTEHGDPLVYAQGLAGMNVPLIVGEGFPVKAPHIQVFPFDAAKELYGAHYLTSSTVYMLAYAMLQGYADVTLYGVDMAVDNHEYFWQRPCMEAWVGFAKGKGLKITIPPQSPLGRSDYVEGRGCGGKPDFSLPPFTQAEFVAMTEHHTAKIAALNSQIAELQAISRTHDGARQAYEKLAQTARAVEAGNKIATLRDAVEIR